MRITSLCLRVAISTVGIARLRLNCRLCATPSRPSALRVSVSTVGFERLCLNRRLCASPTQPSAVRVSVSTVSFLRLRLDRRICGSPSRPWGLRAPSPPSSLRNHVLTVGFGEPVSTVGLRVSISSVWFARLHLVRLDCASPFRPSVLRVFISSVWFAHLRLDRRICAFPSLSLGSDVSEFLILSKRHRISYSVNSFPTIFLIYLFFLSFQYLISSFYCLYIVFSSQTIRCRLDRFFANAKIFIQLR